MEDVRDNPYYQALAAFVAEAAAMGVDVDEVARRAVKGLTEGEKYSLRSGGRAAAGAEVLKNTVHSYKHMLD
ncbi:hypothetical protein [uncultured Pseudomonas sp.]|uniref:hypothetical protein n=1 Tax=uncultured Pseudomonas sp. TaxID=114707 RepID=UPI002589D6F4|nr:hypothetical protein [uncultured Pseudomonas sp.]